MMARLIPTARAMSSICASRTPRSSNSARVASRISFSRALLRTAAADRRPSVLGCVRRSVLMASCYVDLQHRVARRVTSSGAEVRLPTARLSDMPSDWTNEAVVAAVRSRLRQVSAERDGYAQAHVALDAEDILVTFRWRGESKLYGVRFSLANVP